MRIVNYRRVKTLGKLIGKDPLSGQMVQLMSVRGSGCDNGSLRFERAAISHQVLRGKAVGADRRSY
jgi:hypothetical protein